MGKIRTCAVTFKNMKDVFREGELVSGMVMVDVEEPVAVKRVIVSCRGEALTKWSKEFSRDFDSNLVSTEKYFGQVVKLFGRDVSDENGPNQTLPAGKHRWAFAFRLPSSGLPSSIEWEFGAVRWYLRVEVQKPFPSINNKWYRAFTVLSNLDMNQAPYKPGKSKEVSKSVSKALGLGNAGTLTLSVKTNHTGYCPGEAIALTVEAKNESSKDLGKVTVTLVQTMEFKASDETRDAKFDVASMETEMTLAKGTTMKLEDLLLAIPAVPPSTKLRTCHIITCTYSLKVKVHVPWGLDLEAVVPVIIGTIPRGKKLPPPRQAKEAAAEDPSTVIHYRKCESGIVVCRKSEGTFPNLSFVPSTAYVENYVHPSAARPPAASSASARPKAPPAASSASARPKAPPAASSASARPKAPPAASSASARPKAPPTATVTAKALEAGVAPPVVVPGPGPVNPPSRLMPSAPFEDDLPLPPSYDEVLRMDEVSQPTAAKAPAASAAPKGKACAVMVIRFPDNTLDAFRQSIQREENKLLESEEACLVALAPQPLPRHDLGRESGGWPSRVAVALLRFPHVDSGSRWLQEVAKRGDTWYPRCDAFITPAEWTDPPISDTDWLVFSLISCGVKKGVSKAQLAELKTVITLSANTRAKCGGVRQFVSKKQTRSLHGALVKSESNCSVIYWPTLDSVFEYKKEIAAVKQKYGKLLKKTLDYEFSVLLISEDVTPLSTQPTHSLDDEDDEDDKDWDSADESSATAENLLPSAEQKPA